MPAPWRYEPLDPTKFPVGSGPFRARGLAYVGALRYVDTRLPGSRSAFLEALGPRDPFAAYYDQIFLVAGDYDVSPLVRLFHVASQLAGKPLGAFIQRRARWSGGSDTKGIWKPALHGATAADVAGRLHFAFERYFPPCGADVRNAARNHFHGELRRVPACMDGLYADCTIGFYEGALEGARAANVRVHFDTPTSDGSLAGVLLERVRFSVEWDEAK